MARARVKMTGKSRKRGQPVCRVCGKEIQPGEKRYTWSFRYGGTYNQHLEHGAPRPSQLTQGMVGELYEAQEAVEDSMKDQPDSPEGFDEFKSNVAQALTDAADVATDLASRYEEAAEAFGGQGENADRAASCEQWADELSDAASNVEDVQIDEPSEEDFDGDDAEEDFAAAAEQALSDAIDAVTTEAENAIYNLEL